MAKLNKSRSGWRSALKKGLMLKGRRIALHLHLAGGCSNSGVHRMAFRTPEVCRGRISALFWKVLTGIEARETTDQWHWLPSVRDLSRFRSTRDAFVICSNR